MVVSQKRRIFLNSMEELDFKESRKDYHRRIISSKIKLKLNSIR